MSGGFLTYLSDQQLALLDSDGIKFRVLCSHKGPNVSKRTHAFCTFLVRFGLHTEEDIQGFDFDLCREWYRQTVCRHLQPNSRSHLRATINRLSRIYIVCVTVHSTP